MVADIVKGACEPVHVVPIERRNERAVEEVDQLVCEAVALMLQLLHLTSEVIRLVREPVE